MMVARRVAAVVLGILFILSFLGAAFISRANETAFNDDFYISELRRARAPDYFYSDVLPPLIDQAAEGQGPGAKTDLAKLKPQLIEAARSTFPPDWVEQQAEAAVRQIVPYMVGDKDSFTVHVDVAPRIQLAAAAAKKLAGEAAAIDLLYDAVVTPAVRDTLPDPRDVPFGIPATADDIVRRIRRATTDAWLRDQLAKGIDAAAPYVAGEADHFKVSFVPSERVEGIRTELKDLGSRWDARKYLFDNVIDPTVRREVNNVPVPFGLTVTAADVQGVMRDTLTEEWVRARVNDLIDAVVDYISGKVGRFQLAVPLQDRKAAALASVGRLMDAKLAVLYNNTRLCTQEQFQSLRIQDFPRTGIVCRPPGVTLDQVKAVTGLVNYQAVVAAAVDSVLPNTFTFTESDLRSTLDTDQWALLQDVRVWVRDGVSYTDADLEDALAEADWPATSRVKYDDLDQAGRQRARDQSENVKSLREARQHIKAGGTFTQEDLKKRMEENNPGSFQDLQDARDTISSARGYRILAWIIPLVLLIGLALLGGRSVKGKVLWGASFLAIASVILMLGAGPVYRGSYRGQVEQSVRDSLEENIDKATPAEKAVRVKVAAVILDASDQFALGLAKKGVFFFVVSLAAGGGAVGYGIWKKRRSSGAGAPT